MYECTYKAFGGRLLVKFEAEAPTDIFTKMGAIATVLDADQVCGKCGSDIIFPVARTVTGNNVYYELQCGNSRCGARLSFGQHKTGGTLFAKRDGHPDTNGWYVYLALAPGPDQGAYAQPVSQPAPQPRPTQARPPATSPAPRPQGFTPPRSSNDDGRLKFLLTQVKVAPSAVFGELCQELDKLLPSPEDTQRLWDQAQQGGAGDEDIVRFLYGVIKANTPPQQAVG